VDHLYKYVRKKELESNIFKTIIKKLVWGHAMCVIGYDDFYEGGSFLLAVGRYRLGKGGFMGKIFQTLRFLM
jgi:hypothetical protein